MSHARSNCSTWTNSYLVSMCARGPFMLSATCSGLPRNDAASRSRVLPKCLLANLKIQLVCYLITINVCIKVHLVLLHSQVLLPTTMPTLAVALAPSFWMTWCVVDLKQESSTVQGFLVRELEPMTHV